MQVILLRSARANKQYMVRVDGRAIHFGASGYGDFTTHKDERRKAKYIARHRTTQDWSVAGIGSAGFWPRWVLWNKPSLKASVGAVNKRFKSIYVKTDAHSLTKRPYISFT